MRRNKLFRYLSTLIFVMTLAFMGQTAFASKPDDANALKNVETGKVVWDINMVEPKKMSLYLNVIRETYDDLVRQNIVPEMLFAFRGHSVKLVSEDREKFPLEKHMYLDQVHELLMGLAKRPGVKMEACSVAARLFDVDAKTYLQGIKPVGNTFVSLIGYQAKGFAVIPIY